MRTRSQRLLSMVLALSMLLTFLPVSAFADYTPPPYTVSNADTQTLENNNTCTKPGEGTYTYTLNADGTATLSSFTGTGTTVNVPSSVTANDGKTYRVTTIGENVFASYSPTSATSALSSVTLPDSIQTIEHAAFHGCSSLHKITLREGLTTVGNGAFAMAGLTEVTLPKSLKEVGDSAFGSYPAIDTVIYTGTKEDWDKLVNSSDFGDYNTQLTSAPNFYCAAYSITPAPSKPNTEQPGTQQPGTTTPTTPPESTDKPTDKPDNNKPDTNKPNTDQTTPSQKPEQTTPPEVPAVEEDDTAAIGYAAAAVTAAFVGWGAYRIGSEVYLKYLLPKDVLLPQNRIQLAELLWEDAGRPAPADAAAYTDVDANDIDARQAARWAVENGLLTLPDTEKPEEFVPYRSVSYAKSARAWNKAQQLKETAAR